MGWDNDDRHPARSRRGSAGQRPTGSHAPQELRRRWPPAPYGLRKLVSYRAEAPGQRCAVWSSLGAVERFERKFEDMWSKTTNTSATISER